MNTQKINSSRLKTYDMIIALAQVDHKDEKFRFFEETFLLAYIGLKIAFEILFFILSNIEVKFNDWKLKKRLYIATKVFPTTRQVKLIGRKEFAALAFDLVDEIFVVYIAFFPFLNKVNPARRAK